MPVHGRWHSDDVQCRNQPARQASTTQAPKHHRHSSHMICTGYYTIFNDYGGTSSQRRQASKLTGFRLRSESWNLQTMYDRHSTHSRNARARVRLLVRVLRMCTQNMYKTCKHICQTDADEIVCHLWTQDAKRPCRLIN